MLANHARAAALVFFMLPFVAGPTWADEPPVTASAKVKPVVEVAFVLDTTGSMGPLIESAKRKIWSIATAIVDANPDAEIRMGKWLLGQGSLMVILGVLSTIVYLSLGVRYAYALGVLTGALNLIPVLGAAVSIALTLLVAAIDSWGRALGVAVFYVIYLQVENSFLIPRIMKNRVGLPGLAIFVALLLGAALEGVIGAMVSIPTAVLVAILLDEYLVNKDAA